MPAAQTLSKSTPSAPTKPYGDRPPAVKVIQLGKTSASSQHSTRLVLAPVTVQPEHSGSEGEVERFEDPAAARDVEFPSTLLARSRFRLAGGKAVTGHQWKVYDFILRIPVGRVTTYALISRALGSSSQAVGGALRNNPFAPFVPCHRVVASTLFIGGFEGEWAEMKDGEKAQGKIAKKLELLATEGIRFDEKGYLVGGDMVLWSGKDQAKFTGNPTQAIAAAHRRHHDVKHPFNSLPPHLLRHIFACALKSSDSPAQDPDLTIPIHLALVCSAWHGSTQKFLTTSLPAELWLQVLLDNKISYGNLKHPSRVSKAMYRLTKSPSLDYALFRASPNAEKGDYLRIHPALEETIGIGQAVDEFEIEDLDFDSAIKERRKTSSLPCAKEHATSPSVKELTISIAGAEAIARNAKGVTVLDALGAITKIWTKDYGTIFNAWGDEVKNAKLWNLLGDRTGWTGWEGALANEDGAATLTVSGFDS